jgi:hypothetical protein
MKKIIIAIERSKFNYLYKYNICTVSIVNVIDYSFIQLMELYKCNLGSAASIIEKALPIFETEHEVILLEVESSEIGYNLEFGFNAIRCIIPLNEVAMELLQSKLNSDFQYATPMPVDLYESILALREDKLRSNSALSVLSCFNLPAPENPFIDLVKHATRRLIFDEELAKGSGTIDFLLEFNTTPSDIPSGNIEGLMKIICVGMLKVTGNVDKLRLSPLFNLLLDNMDLLNQGTLLTCYQSFKNIANNNRDKVEKLEATLASSEIDADIILLLFLFISFKKEIQKNDFDLKSISFDINEIKSIYIKELSQALYLVGYTMSMGTLHESIHRLRSSPLFEVEKEVEKEVEIENEKLIINEINFVEENTSESINQCDIKYDSTGIDHGITETYVLHNPDGNVESNELDISHNSSSKLNVGASASASDNLFEKMDENEREKLLTEAKKELKGNKSKKLLELVERLYRNNLHFCYSSLEEKVMSVNEFLKKNGTPLKITQDLLNIFKHLK